MNYSMVIVAGGMGKRLGKPIPKAFVPIAGKEMFRYSLELFDEMKRFERIVLVVPAEAVSETEQRIDALNLSTNCVVVAGGEERHNSVENGIRATGEVDIVAIHDAARPFITEEVVNDLLLAVEDCNGVITANPVVDTVREFNGELCGATVDRSKLIAVGTPQVFKREKLINCFDRIECLDSIPTDEAMLLEAFGESVKFVYGDPLNFKVTAPSDMVLAEAVMRMRDAE